MYFFLPLSREFKIIFKYSSIVLENIELKDSNYLSVLALILSPSHPIAKNSRNIKTWNHGFTIELHVILAKYMNYLDVTVKCKTFVQFSLLFICIFCAIISYSHHLFQLWKPSKKNDKPLSHSVIVSLWLKHVPVEIYIPTDGIDTNLRVTSAVFWQASLNGKIICYLQIFST